MLFAYNTALRPRKFSGFGIGLARRQMKGRTVESTFFHNDAEPGEAKHEKFSLVTGVAIDVEKWRRSWWR